MNWPSTRGTGLLHFVCNKNRRNEMTTEGIIRDREEMLLKCDGPNVNIGSHYYNNFQPNYNF